MIYVGGYDFDYSGETYRIESVTPNFREGYNLLLQKQGEKVIFMATDREQDGVLDQVNTGDLSLDDAASIYLEGIRYGHRRGFIKDRVYTREYKTSVDINNYVLMSFVLAMGGVYNKFYMRDLSRRESVLIDEGADGVLDRIEKGNRELGYYQTHYKVVLLRGIHARKVVKIDGRYLVNR
jgi:hypothetical protein